MRNGKWVSVVAVLGGVACSAVAALSGKHLPLPSTAGIYIGKKTAQPSVSDDAMCKEYSVSQREIRHDFATYRIVTDQEKHYLYQVAPCFVDGTVSVRGKTFPWTVNPGGWLSTTYPDGVQKTLGTTDRAYLDTTP